MSIRERFYQKLEEAKWRKNPKAIASKEDPKNPKNSEQDDYYGWEAPRSKGRMTAKGDVPLSSSGLNTRPSAEIATQGPRKGKITKKSGERLKSRIKAKFGLAEEQLDELRGKGTLDKKDKEELQGRIRDKHGKAWTETERIRKEKKSKGSEDTKSIDKFRNRLAKIHNKLDESSPEKIGRYISKASKQKKEIQDKAYADKLEKGDLPKFERRKKGVQLGIKKLTGQAKVPAK